MGTSGTTNSPLVPVLCYHAITETPGHHIAPFTVSPAAFERQLDLLVTEGYRCVTFGEMLRREAAGTLDGRTAVVTFDDGYADFATAALPALKARSIPSTLFVTTGWLEDAAPREP